jgi:cell division protein FtsB
MVKDANPSASRRRPAAPAAPRLLTPRGTKAGRAVRWVLLIFGAVVVIDALVGDRGLLASWRARDEYNALVGTIQTLEADNDRLRDELQRLKDDPAAVEEIARRELGLIRPGEKVFIVKDLPSPAAAF